MSSICKFTCICQHYNGTLQLNPDGCLFSSAAFHVDLKWSNVKKIKLDSKQIRGAPTSVLVIRLDRNVFPDGESSDTSSRRKKKSSSKKYFFHGFQDLLGAEERVKAQWEQWKQSADTHEVETKNVDDVESDQADSTTAVKHDDLDSIDSTQGQGEVTAYSAPAPHGTRFGGNSEANGTTIAPTTVSQRKTTHSLPVHRRANVGDISPQSESPLRALGEKAVVKLAALSNGVFHMVARGGLVYSVIAVFLIGVAMVSVAQVRFGLFTTASVDPISDLKETKRLLSSLESMWDYHREMGQYVSIDGYYKANRKKQNAVEEGKNWIHLLQNAAAELAGRYVLIQEEMLNLRSRRAERCMSTEIGQSTSVAFIWRELFKEGDTRQRKYYLSDPGSAAKEPDVIKADDDSDDPVQPCTGKDCPKTTGRGRYFSTRRVIEDFLFWRRSLTAVGSWLRYGLRSVTGRTFNPLPVSTQGNALLNLLSEKGKGPATLVRYAEPFLDGFDMVQYVVAAEKEERVQCLAVSSRLVKMQKLIEDVLIGFTSVLMADTYEGIASGTEKPHFWGTASPPTTSQTGGANKGKLAHRGLPVFTSDQILHIFLIRRYMQVLLHLNPLESDDRRRRTEAVSLSERLIKYWQVDARLTERWNRTNKDAVLQEFFGNVLPRFFFSDHTATGMSSTLRNIADELLFWDAHEDLWMEHLLVSLPEAHRDKLHELFSLRKKRREASAPRNTINDPAATPNKYLFEDGREVVWSNLPNFKGLLCFTSQPRLQINRDENAELPLCPCGRTTTLDSGPCRPRRAAAQKVAAPQPKFNFFRGSSAEKTDGTEEGDATAAASTGDARAGEAAKGNAPLDRMEEEVDWDTNETDQDESAPAPMNFASASASVRPRYHSSTQFQRMSAEEEFRRLYDSGRLENSVSQFKARWMYELNMLLTAVSPSSVPQLHHRGQRRRRSYHMEEDSEIISPELTSVRLRLFSVLDYINKHYVVPVQKGGSSFFRFTGKWLWPPSWIHHLLFGKEEQEELEAVRRMATDDPTVQLAAAQIVQIPWGSERDAPYMLLKNILVQPPELMHMRARLRSRVLYSWMLFVVGTAVLLAVYLLM